MNRLIALGVFVLALVIGAALWRWAAPGVPPPQAALEAIDYSSPAAWAARPDPLPPAVWEEGWAIDVFLVITAAARSPATADKASVHDYDAGEDALSLGRGLGPIGPVYAPFYAAASSGRDLADALETYLTRDNRGRAFVIATDGVLPASLVAKINADPLARERFGGVLRLTAGRDTQTQFDTFDAEVAEADYCPARLPAGCVAALTIRAQQGRPVIISEPPLGGAVIEGFVAWLDSNGTRLAEPLGEFEEIKVIDIRKPGDTDERRADGVPVDP